MSFKGAIPSQIIDLNGNSITSTQEGSKNGIDVSLISSSVAGIPSIANIAMLLADTEYSFSIPQFTKKITIKTRTSGALKFCFVASQSSTNYLSVSSGTGYTLDGLNTISSSLSIYFQSPKANETLEILIWT